MSPIFPAIYGAATLLLNSTIWIFGGNAGSSTNGLFALDVSKSWSTSSPIFNTFSSNEGIPEGIPPRYFSTMVLGADGSSLWIYGGRSDSSDSTDSDQLFVFNTRNTSWFNAQQQSLLSNGSLPAVFAQSAVRDSKGVAYYYGGSNDLTDTDLTTFDDGPDLLEINTSSNTFSSTQTSGGLAPLAWHTATLVNNTLMYVIGGLNPIPADDFNVTVYNTATNKWSPPFNYTVRPSRRHGHTAVLSADSSQIIVFGGMADPNTYLNDVWTLNLATNQWTLRNTTGTAPTGRGFHSSALVKNQMIVMFGYSQKALNTLYVLDTTKWVWTTSFNPNPPQTTPITTGSNSNNNGTSAPTEDTFQKIPISVAGIAGIVLAVIAVASIVMLSVIQPKNRVKPV